MTNKVITLVEIDVDRCTLTYGTSPCTAAVGTTGDRKCYNTRATCQDTDNYDPAPETLRFAVGSEHLHEVDYGDLPPIPSIAAVRHQPTKINIGEDLGERASVTVRFGDHPHSDIGLDPYPDSRDFDPETVGSFWGKFRARHKFILGRPLRWIEGTTDQALADMETRTYIIESISGPDLNGAVSMTAKDPLKLADGKRAQAPVANNGRLLADLNETATSATLTPTGIGDLEYSASGTLSIGEELMTFTRSSDTLTLVRSVNGVVDSHEADDTVQEALVYSTAVPPTIANDLLTNYAEVDASFIPLTEWQAESSTFIGRSFSATIAEPTSVRKLLSELMEQAGFTLWYSETEAEIKFQAVRPISPTATLLDDSKTVADSFSQRDQLGKRVSQIWTYFGQLNPLEDQDEAANYSSLAISVDTASETDDEYGQPAIKKIYSRWIPRLSRSVALATNARILARFRDPPRLFSARYQRFEGLDFKTGDPMRFSNFTMQNDEGTVTPASAQVISVTASWGEREIQAEEFLFTEQDPVPGNPGDPGASGVNNPVVITYDADENNVNLRSAFDDGAGGAVPTVFTDTLRTVDSVDTGTDTITVSAHGWLEDDIIVFLDGTPPGGLTAGTSYYVINETTNTFQVAATQGGAAINLTSGPGTAQVRPVVYVKGLVEQGVVIGSEDTSLAAFDVGSWPDGVNITVQLRTDAFIVGAGGNGGDGSDFGESENDGGDGGTALYTRQTITLDNDGTVGGGGGGGGGGQVSATASGGGFVSITFGGTGGGGAGRLAGTTNTTFNGENGTLENGGAGGAFSPSGDGGDGGDLGQDGQDGTAADSNGTGTIGTGGTAGTAIDGVSFVTQTGAGSVLGSQIN